MWTNELRISCNSVPEQLSRKHSRTSQSLFTTRKLISFENLYFVNTNNEYPPNNLAANGKLNFENNHRGPLAIAFLIEGCCLNSPNAALVYKQSTIS